jgi:hypothetical protein
MNLRSLALTAVAAGALGISGCGGDGTAASGGGNSSADAKALLAKTFSGSDANKIKSGTIDLKVAGELSGSDSGSGEASATIALNEAKKGEVPQFSADVAVKGEQKGGTKVDIKAGATYTDKRFYVNYDGTDYDVGEELSGRALDSLKSSIKQSAATQQQGDLVAKLGLQPQTWLTDPKVDGEEKIGDTDTYRITGAVDIKAMVPDILDAARAAQKATPAAGSQKIPTVTPAELEKAQKQIEKLNVTIWTGKDDTILRKVEVEAVIKGNKKDDKVDGTLSFTITKVNEQQDIKAPSETKPITDLMPKLSGLFGAASGLGAGATGSTGSSSAANGAVSDAYIECVQSASGDAAKLNACQAKLQK